jgi:hypothetical protein
MSAQTLRRCLLTICLLTGFVLVHCAPGGRISKEASSLVEGEGEPRHLGGSNHDHFYFNLKDPRWVNRKNKADAYQAYDTANHYSITDPPSGHSHIPTDYSQHDIYSHDLKDENIVKTMAEYRQKHRDVYGDWGRMGDNLLAKKAALNLVSHLSRKQVVRLHHGTEAKLIHNSALPSHHTKHWK